MLLFLREEPIALLEAERKKYLIAADLHIGITKELKDHGIYLPSQGETFAKKLNDAAKKTNAKNLIILGDLKHNIPSAKKEEFKDIVKFLSRLNFDKIFIIKGNHDGKIEKILKNVTKKIKIEKRFMRIKDTLLTHGHISIKNIKAKRIIIAHVHPYIRMIDRLKASYYERVWLRYEDEREIIIMPNFNELCGATIVNEQELIGPIAKKMNKKEFEVYLLDGTYLGKIKDFEAKE
ncbi:MAG: metallophosphoesterase [Candidatus Aenigmatarchaeota archaeon]|nr:metallophosphoesterase [Candidatus Aenigmarchaeota archaeon]